MLSGGFALRAVRQYFHLVLLSASARLCFAFIGHCSEGAASACLEVRYRGSRCRLSCRLCGLNPRFSASAAISHNKHHPGSAVKDLVTSARPTSTLAAARLPAGGSLHLRWVTSAMRTAGLSRVIHGFGIFFIIVIIFKRLSPRDCVISSISMAAVASVRPWEPLRGLKVEKQLILSNKHGYKLQIVFVLFLTKWA